MDIPESMTPVIGLVAGLVIIGAIVTVVVQLVQGRRPGRAGAQERRRRDAERNGADPMLYGAAGLALGAGFVGTDGGRKDDSGGSGSGGDGGSSSESGSGSGRDSGGGDGSGGGWDGGASGSSGSGGGWDGGGGFDGGASF